ncbi:hypothetical protein N7510_009521 [Penicillium lagena]|uniref:uncharacterized protein n=1 Tax=Penicillium lagena TaxID=94218 RepID=UPI0025409C8A|nr:uncharacterized protein N7510_009521 [Penicillium lagena]KAJ5604367.1 hypothetical protein N7510_009521 [Penicillium lagena]
MLSPNSFLIPAFFWLLSRALAQNATTITSAGCVDPSGFTACINAAADKEATCINAAGSDVVVLACGLAKEVDEMLCYMSDCWNKIYSCEYQYLVSSYLLQHTTEVSVPFFPAPANAPGGCSCNMGDVLVNATTSISLIESKCSSYTFSSSTKLSECQCCALSAALSAYVALAYLPLPKYVLNHFLNRFYGICPTTDMSQLNIERLTEKVREYSSIVGSCPNLDASICLDQFGIGSADHGTYVDIANLPSGGTQSLSTTEGSGPLTSPPGGATTTVSILGVTYSVTAATYNANNVESGSASSATETSSSSGSATSDGSNDSQGNAGQLAYKAPLSSMYLAIFFLIWLAWL